MTNQDRSDQSSKILSDELGINDLPKNEQEQLMAKMTEVLLKRIFLETIYQLSETDQASYEHMIDENVSSEELENFLREKVAGYDDMVRKVVEDFEEEMKSLI